MGILPVHEPILWYSPSWRAGLGIVARSPGTDCGVGVARMADERRSKKIGVMSLILGM